MARDSFIFYREYKDALNELNDEKLKLQFYEIITEYIFYNNIPKNTDKLVLTMFRIIKEKLDKTNKSYWSYEARRSSRYKKWKSDVLKRDKNKCQKCGSFDNLVVHHIKPFSRNIELRYDVNNGITLCQNCHKEVHKNER